MNDFLKVSEKGAALMAWNKGSAPSPSMKICMVSLAILAAVLTCKNANSQPASTCAGYIGALDAAAQSHDGLGPQAYINLAEKMYRSINDAVVGKQMPPLPLPDDIASQESRAMLVVFQCKQDMSQTYATAVSLAYVKMRQTAGLSVTLPNQ